MDGNRLFDTVDSNADGVIDHYKHAAAVHTGMAIRVMVRSRVRARVSDRGRAEIRSIFYSEPNLSPDRNAIPNIPCHA